jgi:hypothetical protein
MAISVGRGVIAAAALAAACGTVVPLGVPALAPKAIAPPAPAVAAMPAATVAPAAPAAAPASPLAALAAVAPSLAPEPSLRAHSDKARLKRTPGPFAVDDVVLARRFWGMARARPGWNLGTIVAVAVEGDKATLKFFYDDKTEEIPTGLMKAVDWQPKRKLICAHNGQPAGHSEPVDLLEMVGDERVRVSFHNGTLGDEEKTLSIVACSQPPFWHDTLSPMFTEHAKYKRLAAPPKSASAEPPSGQVAGALSLWLSSAEGGSYIQIRKCYVTARWVDLAVGSRHTGRRASTACVVGVPAGDEPKTFEACLVLRGACEQKYLGGGRYGGCAYEASADDPEKIDCHLTE